ncbi:Rad52/Rad22 family DNA repair protein [Erwinia sp. QL-Z3]|uniref:Rad52/Rad22 family DNA repair protein n=1 Tax=Erwinia sp. QL-Z3 TaxID=2547962 RepID=UPI00107111F7|nr:Rad52/Rad22 family DNA repair protein [Erwinia sp. QL-Z3]QBR52760.1 recombinase [Erwinia sp. QL-Z3]
MELSRLDEPFDSGDIEWRVQQSGTTGQGKVYAMVLAYVTNRAIMNRLDEVCGKGFWRNEYQPAPCGGVMCGISIKFDGEGITKWDAAENTQVEAVKGGMSGAMKRAAVQWGIGRYLYNLEEGFAQTSTEKNNAWNRAKTKDGKIFWWAPPTLPSWALPSQKQSPQVQPQPSTPTPVDADKLLSDFTEYAGSENDTAKLRSAYAKAWKDLAGHEEHQEKCKDITGIRLAELKQAA